MAKKSNGRTVSEITVKKYADGFEGPQSTDDKALYKAFSLLAEAKRLEVEAADKKAEAYKILAPNYLTTGMSNLFLPEVGGVEVFQGSNTRTDVGKMCELLVGKYKVPVEDVSAAKQSATKTKDNDKLTVKFKPVVGKRRLAN